MVLQSGFPNHLTGIIPMAKDRKAPQIKDAPGLVWRPRKDGWVCTWQARTDLIKKGYAPQTARLWAGTEPTEIEASHISVQCRRLQSDMLMFAREEGFVSDKPPLTLGELIVKYQTDPDSTYHKKRFAVRKNHNIMLRRISATHGAELLADIKARLLKSWHKEWSGDGVKVAIAHAFVGHLRTIFGFGFTMLEDKECERLCAVMHLMKFPMPKPRTERLTADQAVALRVAGHKRGWDSIALAQSLQFELMLRQKDVIGEWVPVSEPGISATVGPKGKWLMGLRWEEIDDNLILKHNTSKRGKDIEVNLRLAPMVLEELSLHIRTPIANLTRSSLPASGPVILCEVTGYPWSTMEFRRKWRILATAAGIPKTVRNMDSRAGAISEATDAGADLEHVRHAATHSDIGMTQRYSRGSVDKVAGVSRQRVAHRNKPKTSDD
jgi:hypothetical protein